MDSTNKPFISDGKIHYNRTVQERNEEVNAIELDENETKYCLWRGKLDKWYKARNSEYWQNKESKKPSGSSW